MDSLSPVLDGFLVVIEPTNLLYCLIGVVIGMLIGVLPGLGPAATIAILLPLTIGIEPVTSIIMLAGIFYGAQYGGTITSVLLWRIARVNGTTWTTFGPPLRIRCAVTTMAGRRSPASVPAGIPRSSSTTSPGVSI